MGDPTFRHCGNPDARPRHCGTAGEWLFAQVAEVVTRSVVPLLLVAGAWGLSLLTVWRWRRLRADRRG